jgi:hypothetical protein
MTRRVCSTTGKGGSRDGVASELQEQRDDAARVVAAHQRGLKRLDAYGVGAIEVEDLNTRSEAVRARIERARTIWPRPSVDCETVQLTQLGGLRRTRERRLRQTVVARTTHHHSPRTGRRSSTGSRPGGQRLRCPEPAAPPAPGNGHPPNCLVRSKVTRS